MRLAVLAVTLFAGSCATTSPVPTERGGSLRQLVGQWKGTLEYVDYQPPHRLVTLPTVLEVTQTPERWLRLVFTFDDGPGKTVVSTDVMSFGGEALVWGDEREPLAARQRFSVQAQGASVVAEAPGTDDDQPVVVRETFELRGDTFTLVKQTRPAAGGDFILRHRYAFTRQR
jgi:hypothetical protein